MNSALNNFEQLADKYKFVNPITPDLQNFAILHSRKNLKKLLRDAGDFSIIFGFVLSVYSLAKKLGLSITFFQSKVITAFLSISIGISGVTGGNIAISYIIDKYSTNEDKTEQITNDTAGILELDTPVEDTKTINIKHRIGVNLFLGSDKELARSVSNFLAIELIKIVGSDKVTLLGFKERRKTDRIAMGSIRTLGKQKIITAKLVNVENSRAEYVTSEKIESIDGLGEACRKIAVRIVDKLK